MQASFSSLATSTGKWEEAVLNLKDVCGFSSSFSGSTVRGGGATSRSEGTFNKSAHPTSKESHESDSVMVSRPGLSFGGRGPVAWQLRWVRVGDRRVGAGRQQRHHLLIPQLLETGHGCTKNHGGHNQTEGSFSRSISCHEEHSDSESLPQI